MTSNSRIISTDEDPNLRIESFAIVNLRGVSTKLNKYPRKRTRNLLQNSMGSIHIHHLEDLIGSLTSRIIVVLLARMKIRTYGSKALR